MKEGRRIFKSTKFWVTTSIVVVLLVAGTAYGFSVVRAPKVTYVTAIATSSDLQKTVDATGTTRSITEAVLSFDTTGEVKEILVKEGDIVEVGTPLIKLDTTRALSDLDSATEGVRIAEARLAEKQAGARKESIDVSRQSIVVAEASYTAALAALENAKLDASRANDLATEVLNQAKESLVSLQSSEKTLLTVQAQKLASLWQNVASGLKSETIAVRTALSSADRVLGIENRIVNDEFEFVLSAQNSQALISATNAFKEAAIARNKAESKVFALSSSAKPEEILVVVPVVENALALAEETLLETRRALDATTANLENFSDSDLTVLKTAVDTARNSLQTEQERLIGNLQAKDELIATQNKETTAARRAVVDAEATLKRVEAEKEQTISRGLTAVQSAESNASLRAEDLSAAKIALLEAESTPRSVEVLSLIAEVRRAETAVETAQSRLDALQITSPIQGVVSRIEVEVGEIAQIGREVVVIQTAEEQYDVVLDISESDIISISEGQIAHLVFDAFGDARPVNGVVTSVSPAEKIIEGVTYYEATVELSNVPKDIKPGLSVDATLVINELSKVISVPERAIFTNDDGQKFVRILLDNKQVEERIITTGLRGDAGRMEVQGLSEGDVIIISTKTRELASLIMLQMNDRSILMQSTGSLTM